MQQSLKNKKGCKPLHHKWKIQTQEYCFQCKHCSLQKVKSTNIYVPVYPYLQGMLFHITKYVKYLYSNRNTEVYPLKSIWWLKPKCLYKQCNFLEKLMHRVESSHNNQGQKLQIQLLVLNQFQYQMPASNHLLNEEWTESPVPAP